MKTVKRLCAAVLLLGWCPSALADFTVEQTGSIVPTGSWALPIGLFSTSSNIDLVGARITVGDAFSSPVAMGGFSVGGWTQNAISNNGGYLAAASGPGTQSLGLSLHLSGDITDPVMFDIAGFSEGVFLGSYHGSWDGTGSFVYFSPGSWTPSIAQFAHVPAPNSMVLAAMGLCILGVVTRRLA